MRLINRDTDIAVRALLYAAQKGEQVSVSELTHNLHTPRAFLRKILQALSRHGILESSKGKAGGFILAKKPEKIFLTDVMQVFQGKLALNECLFKKAVCPDIRTCALRKQVVTIENSVVKELSTITILTLLKDKSPL